MVRVEVKDDPTARTFWTGLFRPNPEICCLPCPGQLSRGRWPAGTTLSTPAPQNGWEKPTPPSTLSGPSHSAARTPLWWTLSSSVRSASWNPALGSTTGSRCARRTNNSWRELSTIRLSTLIAPRKTWQSVPPDPGVGVRFVDWPNVCPSQST